MFLRVALFRVHLGSARGRGAWHAQGVVPWSLYVRALVPYKFFEVCDGGVGVRGGLF